MGGGRCGSKKRREFGVKKLGTMTLPWGSWKEGPGAQGWARGEMWRRHLHFDRNVRVILCSDHGGPRCGLASERLLFAASSCCSSHHICFALIGRRFLASPDFPRDSSGSL